MIDLRALRESRRISQHELSRRSGIMQSNISFYESGRVTPTIEVIDRLLSALRYELRAVPVKRKKLVDKVLT